MKTMIDRANSLYDSDYKFTDIYMLTTAAEDEPEVPNRAIGGLTGWIDCFDRAHLSGSVFAGGFSFYYLRKFSSHSFYDLFFFLFSETAVRESTHRTVQTQTAFSERGKIFCFQPFPRRNSRQYQIEYRPFCIHYASRESHDRNFSCICEHKHRAG